MAVKHIRILILAGLYAAIVPAAADDEALALWAQYSASGQHFEKLQHLSDGQCLPTKSSIEIPVPKSARVLLVSWQGDRPRCEGNEDTSSEAVTTVVLASHESIEHVLSWYRDKLSGSGLTEYQIPLGLDCECTGRVAVNSRRFVFARLRVEKFCWNKHYRKADPILIIKDSEDPWEDHGYATIIEYQQSAI